MIHSGLLPLLMKASTTSSRLIALALFWPEEFAISSRSSFSSFCRSRSQSSLRMASAPMPALNAFGPYWSIASRYSLSVRICLYCRPVSPGSVTTYAAKYSTCSSARGLMSSSIFMRHGIPLKYQMWDTGTASSICPIRSRLTLARVTSTPHFSQTIPLYLPRLYLPQWHSQSFVGPKMRSQYKPSFSGFNVL